MKRMILAAVFIIAVLAPAAVFAQMGNFDMQYDPQNLGTVTGTVVGQINYNPADPAAGSRGILVSSDNKVSTIFLGPGRYADQIGFMPKVGDTITVNGSKKTVGGQDYFVASSITVAGNNQPFVFRDSSGTPMWACPPTGAGPMVVVPPVGAGPACVTCPQPTCTVCQQAPSSCNTCDTCNKCRKSTCNTCPPVGAGPVMTCPQPSCTVCQQAPSSCNRCDTCNRCRQKVTCPPIGAGPIAAPFDANRIITVSGRIDYVGESVVNGQTVAVATIIPSTGSKRKSYVVLGPMSSLASCINLTCGNKLFVRGSLVCTDAGKMIMATDIKQGCNALSLRSINGCDTWTSTSPTMIE